MTPKNERRELTIPQAADLLGIHRRTAWARVKASGHLNGVPAIQITPHKFVLSRAAFERMLAGETDAPKPPPLPWDG